MTLQHAGRRYSFLVVTTGPVVPASIKPWFSAAYSVLPGVTTLLSAIVPVVPPSSIFLSLARLVRRDEEQAVPDFSARSGSFQRHSGGRHGRNDCHDAFLQIRKARRPRHQPLPLHSRNHHEPRQSSANPLCQFLHPHSQPSVMFMLPIMDH